MAMNQPFTTASPINAVFDYQDFESGVGYVEYQCYTSETSTGIDYHMDKNSFHSAKIETTDLTTGVAQSPAWGTTIDVDFDTNPFREPKTINGEVIINATAGILFYSATAVSFRIIANLYVVNAVGETLLGTVTSGTSTQVSNNAWKSANFTMPISISEQIIKEGEWLRLNIIHSAKTTSASFSSVDTIIGHSPFNLDGNIEPSTQESNYNQTMINIPFKIE